MKNKNKLTLKLHNKIKKDILNNYSNGRKLAFTLFLKLQKFFLYLMNNKAFIKKEEVQEREFSDKETLLSMQQKKIDRNKLSHTVSIR